MHACVVRYPLSPRIMTLSRTFLRAAAGDDIGVRVRCGACEVKASERARVQRKEKRKMAPVWSHRRTINRAFPFGRRLSVSLLKISLKSSMNDALKLDCSILAYSAYIPYIESLDRSDGFTACIHR